MNDASAAEASNTSKREGQGKLKGQAGELPIGRPEAVPSSLVAKMGAARLFGVRPPAVWPECPEAHNPERLRISCSPFTSRTFLHA